MPNITAQTAGLKEAMGPLAAFSKRLPNAQANVLNRMLTKTRSALIPVLTRQTGLSRRIIDKAVKTYRASPQNPRVMLITRGGEISYRYFGAHEVAGGVEATVKGDKVIVAGGFRRSGPSGRRQMVSKLNGQVYVNVDGGRWRGAIRKEKSGEYIPYEMVSGQTAATFNRLVELDLMVEVERELAKLLPTGR
ncbi:MULTISPECIES: hypothetical protein [unclassified Methylobacterium]|uniref:hypothetical protein n=1 Tax=unclassified Methylobacterium TaxID=2615210 RepID=UPI00226AD8DD|nr:MULTISPECIES: hypothetical protein [unclassified Methylobacterium]